MVRNIEWQLVNAPCEIIKHNIAINNKMHMRSVYTRNSTLYVNDNFSSSGDYKCLTFISTLQDLVKHQPENVYFYVKHHSGVRLLAPKLVFRNGIASLAYEIGSGTKYFLDVFLQKFDVKTALILKMICLSQYDMGNSIRDFDHDPIDMLMNHYFRERQPILQYISIEQLLHNGNRSEDYIQAHTRKILNIKTASCYIHLLQFLCNMNVSSTCITCNKFLKHNNNKNVF